MEFAGEHGVEVVESALADGFVEWQEQNERYFGHNYETALH